MLKQIEQWIEDVVLSRQWLGMDAAEWLVVLAAWAGFAFLLYGLYKLLAWRLGTFAARTDTVVDDIAVEVFKKTRLYFIIALALDIAIRVLPVPDDAGIVRWASRIAFLAFLLQTVRWGGSLISLWIENYRVRKLEKDAGAVTMVQAVGFLGRLVLWIVVVLLALQNFGVEITALVASLGIGGIAVALAVQSIFADLFASLAIVFDKPFVVGDFLIIGEFMGSVEHVGLKTTRLRSLSGEQLIFSNSDLIGSRIRNYKRMHERRIAFTIGVVYQTPHRQLARIPGMLREAVEAQTGRVRFDRAHFKGYGDFALQFETVYYVLSPDYNVYMDIQQAINLAIHKRFEEEAIVFAYPTQSLYLEKVPPMARNGQEAPDPPADAARGSDVRDGGTARR